MAAFEARDAQALCKTLSRTAKEVIGKTAHGTEPLECAKDVRRYVAWNDPYRGGGPPRVEDVTTDGDNADATLRLPGGERATIPLSKADGRWRLDGLVDARFGYSMAVNTPRSERLLAPIEPPPRADAGSATLRDARHGADPCPEADMSEYPFIDSPCTVVVAASELPMRLWTAFGVWRLAECDIALKAAFDGPGRAWITEISVSGASPCPDTSGCRDKARHVVPWAATADAGPGGSSIRLHAPNACLDTCIGILEGGWDIDLAGGADGWRARFASPLGATGLHVDGLLRGRGRALTVER